MIYLSLDLGRTTGVCHVVVDEKNGLFDPMHQAFEVPLEPEHIPEYLDYYPPDVLIYETFQYRRMPDVDLFPVELIGVIKYWISVGQVSAHAAQPPSNKTLWDNEKLKKLDLYVPGKPHANDATRHMLYYSTVTDRGNPLRKLYLNALRD